MEIGSLVHDSLLVYYIVVMTDVNSGVKKEAKKLRILIKEYAMGN